MIDGLSGGNRQSRSLHRYGRPQDRAKVFGMIIEVSFGLGFTIGPGLGAIISLPFRL